MKKNQVNNLKRMVLENIFINLASSFIIVVIIKLMYKNNLSSIEEKDKLSIPLALDDHNNGLYILVFLINIFLLLIFTILRESNIISK